MVRVGFVRSLAVLLLLCLPPARVCAAWPHDPNMNLPVSTAAGDQVAPRVVPDGAGGAILAWEDSRSGNKDIYVQRVSASGAPLWTAGGVALSTAAGDQVLPSMIPDGAGGAIVSWESNVGVGESDVYVQRVNAAGVPQWIANGVSLCSAPGFQHAPVIVSDATGGAVVAWADLRNASALNNTVDIYAQRVNAAGVPQWTTDGVALCTLPATRGDPRLAPDGAGGAVAAWSDHRDGVHFHVFAQRVNATGIPQWAADGVALCTLSTDQQSPAIVADGAGGAIVAWSDNRIDAGDLFAQRLNAAGVAQWTPCGAPVCQFAGLQTLPVLVPDGASGAIVAWAEQRGADFDVFAQRLGADGIMKWPANGVTVTAAANTQFIPSMIPDGAGGAIVAWNDYRKGSEYDIYAQRVSPSGQTLWTLDGAAISTAFRDQSVLEQGATAPTSAWLASDGAGGAIIAWEDLRNGGSSDIYAQRIERFGLLGDPEPSIVQVKDVPNDQGGTVNIQWTASYLDVAPANPLDAYWIWRQVPTAAAKAALERGAPLFDAHAAPRSGMIRLTAENAAVYYWEFVASQVAHGFTGYSYTASTLSDSVAGGNPYTRFMVEAEQTSTGRYWSSSPDSGYSVDNLAPATPAPFAGRFDAGVTRLHWGANREADFATYRLYRGDDPGFVPGPGNLVAALADTSYADASGRTYDYKLSAVDVHGNEGGFATALPEGTLDAPANRPVTQLSLGPAQPNPVSDGAVFRYALPHAAVVRLTLYDQQGRRVRELVNGPLAAGEHTARWDGHDHAGHAVPSGVYLCRLESEGRTLSRLLTAIR